MRFIDEVTIDVRGGKGGDGSRAMRREKFVPLGGPAGGNGGEGGDVVLVADPQLRTLLDLHYRRSLQAESGEHGRGKDQHGKGGRDLDVRVPLGTQIFEATDGVLLADLDIEGARFIAAHGGKGGYGNKHFVTPYDRAPLTAEKGHPGETRTLRLELKLLADVGLVGFPNVGKSTLIAAVSQARPKIAEYPFTTLVPQLGVVSLGVDRSFVVADIPGIIEGAAQGAGLGLRFLKHIERTQVLVHVLAVDPDEGREPVRDFDLLMRELRAFDAALASRPMLIALNKTDLPETEQSLAHIVKQMEARGHSVFAVSAVSRQGLEPLMLALETLLKSAATDEKATQHRS
ncbi:MAG: GTPase ObgE [Myxococcales bacterium]|nr:GTPase ObgE [Myxococcales bacterium]